MISCISMAWFLLIAWNIAGREMPRRRHMSVAILTAASLLWLVLLVQHVHHLRGAFEPYAPAEDEIQAPAPSHPYRNYTRGVQWANSRSAGLPITFGAIALSANQEYGTSKRDALALVTPTHP